MLREKWMRTTAIAALMAAATAPAKAVVIQADNFNDNVLDGSKWVAVTAGIPQAGAAVVEQNMQIELTGRGHLNTVNQHDPNAQAQQGLLISGQWTFVSNDDFMQVLTRSSGVPGGGFGETTSGIEFQVGAAGVGGNMTITNRSGTTVTGLSNNGVLGAAAGETYNFEIRDTGSNLYFTMSQVGGSKQRTVVATSVTDTATDFISFHNRESGRRSNIDNISIESPSFLGQSFQFPVHLQDDFTDNSLDASKWKVVTAGVPNGGGSVTEVNSRIQLVGRAHLVTQEEFNPTDGGIRVEGRWTFGNDDFMQILTRSDGTPGGSFGETLNGIQFFAWDGNDTMSITQMVNGTNTTLSSVGINLTAGEVFDFLITDDGSNLLFQLTQVGGDGTVAQVSAISSQIYADNFITFHNREAGRTAFLDDVVISSLTPVPEPATAMLGLFGLATLSLRRKRHA